ncbi:T9SS type A sorting domain-containing protein, partial [Flavobacterium zhairuonense]|uniref:T9SS sorting signal type C domain-containing protein n=1 Tax=Flavobacterium zhairuonense TaxID=2493631 RepID=UPI00104D468F
WGTGSVVGTNPISGATLSTYTTPTLTGNATYWVRIENTTSPCTATNGGISQVVTVNPLPTVSPIAGGATTVCTGLTTPAFTNATTGGTWSINPVTGTATIDGSGVVTAGNAGDVTVVYTYSNGTCSNTATTALTIKPNYPAPTVGTVIRPTCSALGGSVTLGGLPASGNLFVDNGTTVVSRAFTSSTPTIDQLVPGTYRFALDNGCTATYSAPVAILANTFTGGTSWSYGSNPTSDDYVDFASDYTVAADATYCSVTVSNGAKVVVNSGTTLTVTNGVHVVSGSYLTFKTSSNLMQGNTSNTLNTGSINYERDAGKIRQADYVYWSTPVKNQTLAALSQFTSPSKLYAYDGTKWVFTPRTTVMTAGKGYIVRGPDTYSNTTKTDFTGVFIGTPQNGTFTGETMVGGQFYLLGNPYPSALSADAFITANNTLLDGTLYFWTHNTPVVLIGAYQYTTDDYAVYNLSGGTGTSPAPSKDNTDLDDPNDNFPSGYIGAGQAFFAGTIGSGNVTYTNSMRRSKDSSGGNANGQFFKPGKTSKTATIEKNRVWLNLTNDGGAFKQLLVAYIEGATNNYERLYDGKTFDGNQYLDFYSINENQKLVIQGRALPFTDIDEVPLGYRTTIAGAFTISIDHVDGSMTSQAIFIEDKKTGTIHDLTKSNFTFNTEIGTFGDRLVLKYTNKSLGTGDFENTEKGITVSVKDKVIKVLSSNETIKEVIVFDTAGKLLYDKKKVGSNELQISNLQSSNQVLLIDITLENGYKTTRKLIFQ